MPSRSTTLLGAIVLCNVLSLWLLTGMIGLIVPKAEMGSALMALPPTTKFVMYTARVGDDSKPMPPEHCAVFSQFKYARRHGYEYHFFSDPESHWMEEKKKHNLGYGWFKIHALRHLLASPEYDWIIYLDNDAFISDPEVKLEDIVGQALNVSDKTSLIMYDDKGWNSHMMYIRNTEFSRNMIELIWSLRTRYNRCPAFEQCAVNYGLLDVILAQEAVASGGTTQVFTVPTDKNEKPCCDPLVQHKENDLSMQGCVWRWMDTLQVRQRNVHPFVFWSRPLYKDLNIKHISGGKGNTKTLCLDTVEADNVPPISRLPDKQPMDSFEYKPHFRVVIDKKEPTSCGVEPL